MNQIKNQPYKNIAGRERKAYLSKISNPSPITKPELEVSRADYLKRRWRVAILSSIFYVSISKKWKQARKITNFITAAIDDLDQRLYPFFKPVRDITTEVSVDGADFLVKDGLGSLFSKKPTKVQTQKISNAIAIILDVVSKVNLTGSSKSKELVKRIISAEDLPKSFYWDNEVHPSKDKDSQVTVLVYFILIKCIMAKMVFRAGMAYSELEERNTRALAYILYKMARSLIKESNPLPIESQFKKIILGFTGSQEEVNYWNDATCKNLFRSFAGEISSGIIKLNEWANSEISSLNKPESRISVTLNTASAVLNAPLEPAAVHMDDSPSPSKEPPTLTELMQAASQKDIVPLPSSAPVAGAIAAPFSNSKLSSSRKASLTKGNLKSSAKDLKKSTVNLKKSIVLPPNSPIKQEVTSTKT